MTTLNQAIGTGVFVELGGRKLRVSPLSPADFAEAVAYRKSTIPNPMAELKELIKDLPEAVQIHIGGKAYDDYKQWGTLSSHEGKAWAQSIEGGSYLTYLSLKKLQPEVTHEWIMSTMSNLLLAEMEKIQAAMMEASGFAPTGTPAKNSRRPTLSNSSSAARKKKRKAKASRKD